MAIEVSQTDSRQRVLDRAERLFTARGYTAVSMRDIADSLAMRQASLYYHVPEGKEQLYIEVAMRNLQRHRQGISEAIAATVDKQLGERLAAVAHWFMDSAPLRLLSMLETDMAALSEEHAAYLTEQAYQALFAPIAALFAEAQERGEIRAISSMQLAGYFLALMDGISYSATSGMADKAMDVLMADALDILMNGLLRQDASEASTTNSKHDKKENGS